MYCSLCQSLRATGELQGRGFMFGQRISSTVRSVALPSKNSLHLISRAIFGASRVVEGDYPGLALPVPLGGRNVKLAPPGAEITLTLLSAAACRVCSQRSTVQRCTTNFGTPCHETAAKQCRFEL